MAFVPLADTKTYINSGNFKLIEFYSIVVPLLDREGIIYTYEVIDYNETKAINLYTLTRLPDYLIQEIIKRNLKDNIFDKKQINKTENFIL